MLCVRYVPTDWASKVELTLEEVNRLNKLNLELASELAVVDQVYTPFQHGNFTCIMIKEVCVSVCIRTYVRVRVPVCSPYLLVQCSAYLASGSDPTDDSRRKLIDLATQ